MEKQTVTASLMICFSLLFALTSFSTSSTEPGVQFSPIQDMINNASVGSTINIPPGTYYGLFKVNKNLTLIGYDVIIDANYSQVGIIISGSSVKPSSWVKLEGFTIKNVVRFGNGTISDEISELCRYPQMEGAGIYVYDSATVEIKNVTVTQAYAGIGVAHYSHLTIVNSKISNTTWGIIADTTSLKVITSLIAHNGDNNNGGGIWLGRCVSLELSNSTIIGNRYGITVLPESWINQIHFNIFENTYQAYIHPDAGTVASWTNNYWSDYTGVDANADGIGDMPYIINSCNKDQYPLMSDPTDTKDPPPAAGGGGDSKVYLR